MLTLLIQKTSKNSKAKDHLKALERRMKLSKKKGDINKLVNGSNTMQRRLPFYLNPNS